MKITVIEKNTVGDMIQERTAEVDYGENKICDRVNCLVEGLLGALQEPEEYDGNSVPTLSGDRKGEE